MQLSHLASGLIVCTVFFTVPTGKIFNFISPFDYISDLCFRKDFEMGNTGGLIKVLEIGTTYFETGYLTKDDKKSSI